MYGPAFSASAFFISSSCFLSGSSTRLDMIYQNDSRHIRTRDQSIEDDQRIIVIKGDMAILGIRSINRFGPVFCHWTWTPVVPWLCLPWSRCKLVSLCCWLWPVHWQSVCVACSMFLPAWLLFDAVWGKPLDAHKIQWFNETNSEPLQCAIGKNIYFGCHPLNFDLCDQ